MMLLCPFFVILINFFFQASLFGVPIYPWMMYAVLVGFTFTMLILFNRVSTPLLNISEKKKWITIRTRITFNGIF